MIERKALGMGQGGSRGTETDEAKDTAGTRDDRHYRPFSEGSWRAMTLHDLKQGKNLIKFPVWKDFSGLTQEKKTGRGQDWSQKDLLDCSCCRPGEEVTVAWTNALSERWRDE